MRLVGYIFTRYLPPRASAAEIDSMALLQDVVYAAFSRLAVNTDDVGIVFSSHILRIDRKIRDRPFVTLLLLSPCHPLGDGILVGANAVVKSCIRLPFIYMHAGQPFIGLRMRFISEKNQVRDLRRGNTY